MEHDCGTAEDLPFVTEGLLAGTPVATPEGWLPVEALGPGDQVLTFDAGPQPVLAVQSGLVEAGREGWPEEHWPLLIPAGALDNREELRLLPGQPLLIDSDLSEAMFGDAFTLIPAGALNGWRGIAPLPPRGQEPVIQLLLGRSALVYAAGPVLLLCPADTPDGLPGLEEEIASPDYLPLPLAAARDLVTAFIAAEASAGPSDPALPDGHAQAALRALSP